MATLRFAIVGCGRIAQRHALQIQTVGTLVAVCDIVEERTRIFADLYKAECFFSINDLLAADPAVDVVVICTPNGLHAEHSILAMGKGYHVLVEKPMALTSADARKMIETAEYTKKKLFIVVQNRFNPPVLAVKKALDENAFGKISSVQLTCFWNRDEKYYAENWKGTLAMDGGILYTQFSHFIDLLYWFFGDVATAAGVATNSQHQQMIAFEDCGVAVALFESGIIAGIHFSINSYQQNREGSLTISGEKGMVKIGGEYLNTIEYAVFENYQLAIPDSAGSANDYGTYKGSMSNHDKVYQCLAENLKTGQPYYADAYEGMKTVEIIEKIYASVQTS
jgi:UDP-N-acetyl-2-amino-2-deoxyglucuronate dehydrogenase